MLLLPRPPVEFDRKSIFDLFISVLLLFCFRIQINAPGIQINTPVTLVVRVQELCESRGGRPGLSVLTSLKPVLNWANVSSRT